MYQKTLISRFLAVLSFTLLALQFAHTQSFTATQNENDAYIDLNWRIDADPCLLDAMDNQYTGTQANMAIALYGNSQLLSSQNFDENSLSPFFGPPQPEFDFVTQITNPLGFYSFDFSSDIYIQNANNYTVELWMRSQAETSYLFNDIFPNSNIRLVNHTSIVFNEFGTEVGSISFDSLRTDAWNHFAFAANGLGQTLIYVNGEYKGAVNHKFPLTDFRSFGGTIGTSYAEMRIWDRVRNPAEISGNYFVTSFAPEPQNLIIQLKHANDPDSLMIDYAILGEIDHQFQIDTNYATTVPYISTPLYSPIVGSFRHNIGSGQTVNYEIQLFYNSFLLEPECGTQFATGQTLPYQVPTDIEVSNDKIAKISVRWTNNSTLTSSFSVKRDGHVIETISSGIADGDTFYIEDIFEFDDVSSIVNGTSYNYTIEAFSAQTNTTYPEVAGVGSTIPINFQATDLGAGFADKIQTSWSNTISDFADKFELRRNEDFVIFLDNELSGYTDFLPIYGEPNEFEFILWKNDQPFVSGTDIGTVPANGMIKGRVLTQKGNYPVAGVTVSTIAQNGSSSGTTVTNALGEFEIGGLTYGLIDSFSLEATLNGHGFVQVSDTFHTLTRNESTVDGIIILDTKDYNDDNTTVSINSFTATPLSENDKVQLDWDASSNNSNVFIELTRDGHLVYVGQGLSNLTQQVFDGDGVPGAKVNYQLRIFTINADKVKETSQKLQVDYPEVSIVNAVGFNVVPDLSIGVINLNWSHTSTNISGYNIYRNDKLIGELGSTVITFKDSSVVFNTDLTYSIAATRSVENVNFEANPRTVGSPDPVNLGAFPVPINVVATELPENPSVKISWQVPSGVGLNYNFTGYRIYRGAELISVVYKDRILEVEDREGFEYSGSYYVSSFLQNEDGSIEESGIVASNSMSYPPLPTVPHLNTQVVGNAWLNLYMPFDFLDTFRPNNINGYKWYKDGVLKETTPPHMYFYPEGDLTPGTYTYEVRTFRNVDGAIFLSDPLSKQVIIDNVASPLAAPSNLIASTDLPNHVKLCWEYPPFIPANFVIQSFKNGIQILSDTLPSGTLSYYDYLAQPADSETRYNIRAFIDDTYSKNVYAFGDVVDRKSIYGTVKSSVTGSGVPNVAVRIKVNGPIINLPTGPLPYPNFVVHEVKTDSTGFYYFDFDYRTDFGNEFSFYLEAESPNSEMLIDSIPITIGSNLTFCNIDMLDTYEYPTSNVKTSQISHLGITPDTMSLNMLVHFNTENNQYTRVEISRGLVDFDDVSTVQSKVVTDTTAAPGIGYGYALRTIQENEDDRLASAYKVIQGQVPGLESVINLTATNLENDNAVWLQWSHRYNNASKYVILRNNVFLSEVDRNSPFQYVDKSGSPGTNYSYTLIAVKEREGNLYNSDPVSVEIRFPIVSSPSNLIASIPFLNDVFLVDSMPLDTQYELNHVQLKWTYSDTNIQAFKVYRNNEIIATLDKSSKSYMDFKFIPSSNVNYSVSVSKLMNGTLLESALSKVCPQEGVCLTYPELAPPSNFDIEFRDSLADILFKLDYLPKGADGFHIYRSHTLEFETFEFEHDTVFTYQHNSKLDSASLEFVYKKSPVYWDLFYAIQAFAIRDGIEYRSEIIPFPNRVFQLPFPPPSNFIATDGKLINAVKLSWDYPAEIPLESPFRLIRSNPDNFSENVEFSIDAGQRSFIDSIDYVPAAGYWDYNLISFYNGFNVIYIGAEETGHPALDNASTPYHINTYINTMAPDVMIDSNLMFVGKPDIDRIEIYKFTPEPTGSPNESLGWNLIQTIHVPMSNGHFGYSIDYADRILVIGGIATSNVTHVGLQIYEFDGDETFTLQLSYTSPSYDPEEGFDVATDERVVLLGDYEDNLVKGYHDKDGDGNWTVISQEYYNPFSIENRFGWSIDLQNDTLVVGSPKNKSIVDGVLKETGTVEIYTIEGTAIVPQQTLEYDFITYPQSDKSIEMGWDVKLHGNTLAVTAPDLEKPGTGSQQRHGGVLMFERDANGLFQFDARIFQLTSVHEEDFGYRVDMADDLMIATRPNVHDVSNTTKTSVFKRINGSWNEFDISRSDFQATGATFAPDMGRGVAISESHVAITGSYFQTRFVELFPNRLYNVQATDGTDPFVRLTWNVESDPDLYAEISIYRDNELIAVLNNDALSFMDKPENLLDTATVAIIGKKYAYEVRPRLSFGFKNEVFSDEQFDSGYTKANGLLAGLIYVSGTSIPVENVEVTCSAMINEHFYSYKMITGSDGAFSFDSLPYAADGTNYSILPKYLDHQFDLVSPFFIPALEPTSFTESSIIFYDTEAYTIFGDVKKQDAQCGLDDIKVVLCKTINGLTSRADSTLTQNGKYSFAVNPQEVGLEKLSVFVPSVQTFDSGDINDLDSIRFGFKTNEVSFFTDLANFESFNEVNYIDTLTYPVQVQVQNTCGAPISSNTFDVRIYTSDGCFYETYTTNQSGLLVENLLVNNYLIVVNKANGSSSDDLSAAEYLSSRPAALNILDAHEAAELALPNPFETVKLTYHKAATFGTFNNVFDRYICDDSNQPAIITQGEEYRIPLSVSESFIPSCQVGEGYIVARNTAADSATITTIHFEGNGFEDYAFKAGFPNLVAPHLFEIVFSYFSEAGDLLATTAQVVIVEGEKALPGSGVVVEPDQDANGQVKLPMIILRDPPGDQSYAKLEQGGSYTKSYEFDLSRDNNGGMYNSGTALFGAGLLVGGFWELDARWGRSTSDRSSLEFTLENVESFSTSISEEAVGREANVIVGAGFASQYGLTQRLEVLDCDSVVVENKLRFGLSDMATTWSYTVKFIENLINEGINDSLLIERGLKNYFYADGSPYSQADARIKVSALIQSWKDILHYQDVESVPYYSLCNSNAFLDDVTNQDALNEIYNWRSAFCDEIGSFIGHGYVMDESISWEDNLLVTKYNNTIAAIEVLKNWPNEIALDPNVIFSQANFTNQNYTTANQYHNSLGVDQSKSAEIIDVSGQVLREKTVTTQQSGSASYEYTGYSNIQLKAGAAFSFEGKVTIPIINQEIDVAKSEAKFGFAYSGSSSEKTTRAQADQNTSSMYYRILDGDEDDQVSVLVMQGPMQNHSPYFIRLGGKSSCPAEEALTVGNDSDPISIDNPYIAVINDDSGAVIASGEEEANHYAPPVYNIPLGNVAEFDLVIANNSSTTLTRDIEVFMPIQSNPNGGIVTLNGSPIGLTPILIEDVPSTNGGGSALPFVLRIERPNGDDYDFENIQIGVRPGCDGDAKFIYVSTHFQSPCSPVSLTSPINGFVVNREKVNDPNDREFIRFTLRDYQSANLNLDEIQLQYQRLGTGIGWENVPNGLISRSTLVANDAMISANQLPVYFFDWDITGQYNLYPDGDYALRAVAVCNAGGNKYSNEVSGEIRRTQIITGNIEPADGIWSIGDEISIAFSQNLDCGLLSTPAYIDSNFILLDMTTGLKVEIDLVCQSNKLMYQPVGGMNQYDGHIFKAISSQVQNIQGNFAQDKEWTFRVITQDAEWKEELVEVFLYEGSVVSYKTELLNTTGSPVSDLTLLPSNASESWLQVLPNTTFNLPVDGMLATLNFTGNEPVGVYDDTLVITGMSGRIPEMPVRLHILPAPPQIEVSHSYGDSMLLLINWRFDDELDLSSDTLDQIQAFIGNEVRGMARVEQTGPFYQAAIWVYGETADGGTPVDFQVWNSDEGNLYEGERIPTSIEFEKDAVLGATHSPEVLIVENGPIIRKRIYVDSAQVNNTPDGTNWSQAFDKLEDALAIAMPFDTIWMAEGNYYPTTGTDRNATFDMSTSLIVYGGFEFGQNSINQRTGNSITKISGDIGVKGEKSDNSYHVVTSTSDFLILDGVNLENGNANSFGVNSAGGAMTNTGFVTFRNCSLHAFASTEDGSIILNSGPEAKMILQNIQLSSEGAKAWIKNEQGARMTVVGKVE